MCSSRVPALTAASCAHARHKCPMASTRNGQSTSRRRTFLAMMGGQNCHAKVVPVIEKLEGAPLDWQGAKRLPRETKSSVNFGPHA
jgi:hypothetical protein